mgnify:CR=1 FL=1
MIACPNPNCLNKSNALLVESKHLYMVRKQKIDGLRTIICKVCKLSFDQKAVIVSHNSHQRYTKLVLRMLLSGKAEDRICDELDIAQEVLMEQIDFMCDQLTLFERSMLFFAEDDVFKDTMIVTVCDGMIAVQIDKTSGYITDMAPQIQHNSNASSHDAGVNVFIKAAKKKMKIFVDYIENPSGCDPEAVKKLFQVFRIYYDYCVTASNNETPAMTAGVSLKKVDFVGMFK